MTASVSVFQISGGYPQTEQPCVKSTEGSPERSFTDGTLFIGYMSYGKGDNLYNWASNATPTQWGTAYLNFPYSGGTNPHGDPWAASSGPSTGLEYISGILDDVATGNGGIGIVANTAANIRHASWPWSMNFAVPPPPVGFYDGPSIHYDLYSPTLWAAGTLDDGHHVFVYKNCGYGQPGGAQCPKTSDVYAVPNGRGHAVVVTNPCTSDGVLAYRQPSNSAVRLRFYTHDGVEVNPPGFVVPGRFPWLGASTRCAGLDGPIPKCPGEPTSGDCSEDGLPHCMRVTDKVHVVTTYAQSLGACLAYVTYGYSCTTNGPDGYTHMKAHLDIVDITNEYAPFVWQTYNSSSCRNDSANDFEPTVTANLFTANVGWFYYSQVNGNPCLTTYQAWVDTDRGLYGMTPLGAISGVFPTVLFSGNYGLGDYVNLIKGGLAGGELFPSWSEAVQLTSGSCVTCQNNKQYSLRIMGASITP